MDWTSSPDAALPARRGLAVGRSSCRAQRLTARERAGDERDEQAGRHREHAASSSAASRAAASASRARAFGRGLLERGLGVELELRARPHVLRRRAPFERGRGVADRFEIGGQRRQAAHVAACASSGALLRRDRGHPRGDRQRRMTVGLAVHDSARRCYRRFRRRLAGETPGCAGAPCAPATSTCPRRCRGCGRLHDDRSPPHRGAGTPRATLPAAP